MFGIQRKWIIVAVVLIAAIAGIVFYYRQVVYSTKGGADITDLSASYAAEEETNAALEKFRNAPNENRAQLIKPKQTAEKVVYLYFDGMPDRPLAGKILDTLDKYDAKAVFFVEGQNAGDDPETIKLMYKRQQEIGNYTWLGRPHFEQYPSEDAIRSICRTQKAVGMLSPTAPRYFRAPQTQYIDTVLQEAGAAGIPYVVESNVTVRPEQLVDDAAAQALVATIKPGSLVACIINRPLDTKVITKGKTDERPAIDKKPDINDADWTKAPATPRDPAAEIERLVKALHDAGYTMRALALYPF